MEQLDELHNRFQVGLITNGAHSIQRHKIRRAGLENSFDATLVSGEYGAGKPSPGIFRYALDLLACRPEQAVMIGDSPRSDIAGAKKVGMGAVQIKRHDHVELAQEADTVVSDLSEVAELFVG